MKKLKIALVGRPNVGKSALFNRIVKKRIAIVDEAEGVTRDRLYHQAECFGTSFQMIDTGGIDPQSTADFQEEIRRQAEIAIEEADGIILVVDGAIGMTSLDSFVASLLRKRGKEVVVAVNKVDDRSKEDLIYPFYALGFEDVFGVSAIHNNQIAELLETLFANLPKGEVEEEADTAIKVAIVGRPNVGKSTIVNHLLGEERCVVSPIAGTTRDSIDTPISWEGDQFILIDTAGIRRKSAEHDVVDKFAAVRTERALDRCDVCVLVLDADRGMTTQEKKIAREIEEQGKGCIVVFNKWDLVKGSRMEHCRKSFEIDVPFLLHCPVLFASAKTGRNLTNLFGEVKKVYAEQNRRVSTGQLNKFVERAMQRYHPPMLQGGKRLRVYYLAQVDVQPPRFVLFVNRADLMSDTYKKYLIGQFRKEYAFQGSPIRFFLKARSQKNKAEKTSAPSELLESTQGAEELIFDTMDSALVAESSEAQIDPSYLN